jgi:L-lactate utilization protein LutB
MLQKEADKLQFQLSVQFPLVGSQNRYGSSTISNYEVRHLTDLTKLKSLPASLQKKHAALLKKSKALEKQEEAIAKEWDTITEEVETVQSAHQIRFKQTKEKLDESVQHAVIKIQFAEDAKEAEVILSSLPDISELLAE